MRRDGVTAGKKRVRYLSLVLMFLTGCAVPEMQREIPAMHPANPSAPSSTAGAPPNPFVLLSTFKRPREGAASEQMPGMEHEKGVMPATEHGGEGGAAKVQYTCPMHSEVVQDAPGSCPKCGMALKAVPPASHEHEEENR